MAEPKRFRPDHLPRAKRASAAKRGYDRAWARLSKRKKEADPLCEDCLDEGKVTPVYEVDHIIPIDEAPELRLVWRNLRSLCRSHHKRKTDRDKGKA
ncbi:MAG: HNH endonuclease [Verrucomicrobiae bacterium]|nr:HNH endonuclease [Verrucomicrobiae bacterium]